MHSVMYKNNYLLSAFLSDLSVILELLIIKGEHREMCNEIRRDELYSVKDS